MSWGLGPWGETPWGGGAPSVSPPASTNPEIFSIDLISKNLIRINFNTLMANNLVLNDVSSYTITPNGVGDEVEIREIKTADTPSVTSVLLRITAVTVGEKYTIVVSTSVQNSAGLAMSSPTNQKILTGRFTKLDLIREDQPLNYRGNFDSIPDILLAAISLEDDLIGGSRNDRDE